MVEQKYICSICENTYDSLSKAKACEDKGVIGIELPLGLILKNKDGEYNVLKKILRGHELFYQFETIFENLTRIRIFENQKYGELDSEFSKINNEIETESDPVKIKVLEERRSALMYYAKVMQRYRESSFFSYDKSPNVSVRPSNYNFEEVRGLKLLDEDEFLEISTLIKEGKSFGRVRDRLSFRIIKMDFHRTCESLEDILNS